MSGTSDMSVTLFHKCTSKAEHFLRNNHNAENKQKDGNYSIIYNSENI